MAGGWSLSRGEGIVLEGLKLVEWGIESCGGVEVMGCWFKK